MEDEEVARKIKQLEERLMAPDFEAVGSAASSYKCMVCGKPIRKGSKCLYVPLSNRYCCTECGNSNYEDIIAQNTRVRDRKFKELEALKGNRPKKKRPKPEAEPARKPSDARGRILERCRELFGPYKTYSTKVVEAEIDRLVADGKTEEGILYALNWWYSQAASDPGKAGGKLSIIDHVYGNAMRAYGSKRAVRESLKGAQEARTVEVVAYEDTRKPRVRLFDLQ